MSTKTRSRPAPRAPGVIAPRGAPEKNRKYRAPALEKGIDILELMAKRGAPMTLSQISVALSRSVSELFRMVQALEYKGYIAPASAGEGYVLTNRLFTLGMTQAPTKTLLEAALPVMRRLASATMQSCHLGVPSDEQIAVVARIEAPGDLGFSVRVGYRRPAIDATSGAVMFSAQPEEVREEWLARITAGADQARIDKFLKRAEKVREDGYAMLASDFVQGVTDLSAPVIGAYRAVAAITIPFVMRLPPVCSIEEAAQLVRDAAAEISAELKAAD